MALFWGIASALTLVALAFLLVPLWRESRESGNRAVSGPLAAIAVAPVAVALYFYVTTFDPDAPLEAMHEDFALLEQLAARLADDPDDVDGWVLLGRSYMELEDYGRAQAALEEAWKRTENPDVNLKLIYAQTMLIAQEGAALGLAGDLVEEVLVTSPGNEAALFWGGIVAAERNQPGVAADRWTRLLATNPPPEIAELLRSQLMALTGRPVAERPPAVATGPVIEVDIRVGEGMMPRSVGPDAFLYLFARSPAGGPPIVARQLPLASLPGRFELSDADAMIAGRSLAGNETVTVVARISVTGQPTEQPGDIYAEATVDPAAGEIVSLVIDRVVP
jgi:cytochrome c-type biogenesis protein CcmH